MRAPVETGRRAPRASAVAVRKAILEAALHAFSTYGFDAVSTRAIAAAAGVEQGHLAYYFPSKEMLWRETVASFHGEFERLLEADMSPIRCDLPGETAAALIRRLLLFFAGRRALMRLMLQEFSVQSPRHDRLVSEVGRPTWEALEPLFAALAARRTPPIDPALLYFSFLGAALLFFGARAEVVAITGADADEAKAINDFIELQISNLIGQPRM